MNTQEAIEQLEKELKWIQNPVSTNDPKSPTAQALTHAIEHMKRCEMIDAPEVKE